MTFEEKRRLAIRELEKARIWEPNYNPPIIKLMHRLGFKVPFPHYNSFLHNALFTGTLFSVLWGASMYFFAWKEQQIPLRVIVIALFSTGLFFGACMASYYRYGFKKYKLTPWHEMKANQRKPDTGNP